MADKMTSFGFSINLLKSTRTIRPDHTMRGTQFAELSAFVAVAEHASFTKAAKQLHLSTATVSQTVRALEERLGVRLLNRTTRSVAPTEAGERLLAQLRPLLDDFESAVESVNAFRDKPAGRLRLTVPPPVASLVLGPLLARFLTEYPDIEVDISVDSAMVDIVAGRFDAGIRIGERVARDMIAVRITNNVRSAVVASPAYLAQHAAPRTPDELEAHNCIRVRFPGGEFAPWEFLVDGQVRAWDVAGSVIANEADLAIRAALDGVGLLYVLSEYVATMVADGRLVAVLDHCIPPPSDGFFLYYPSRRQNPAALQALIEFLRRNLKTGAAAA
jgi:LysR family transcriptional regulator, regulator of peptidoglycan recycling